MVIYTKLNLQLQSQNKVFVSHYQQKIQTYENLLKINFIINLEPIKIT